MAPERYMSPTRRSPIKQHAEWIFGGTYTKWINTRKLEPNQDSQLASTFTADANGYVHFGTNSEDRIACPNSPQSKSYEHGTFPYKSFDIWGYKIGETNFCLREIRLTDK